MEKKSDKTQPTWTAFHIPYAAPLPYTLTESSVKAIAETKVVKFNYSE
jgi:hypothetical protein